MNRFPFWCGRSLLALVLGVFANALLPASDALAVTYNVQDLGLPSGDTRAYANFMSPDGALIAGSACNDVEGWCRGFAWTQATGSVALVLPGHVESSIFQISNTTVLGLSCSPYDDELGVQFCQLVAWTAAGGLQALTLPSTVDSYVHALSENSDWLLGRSCELYGNNCRGFVWTLASGVVELGPNVNPRAATADASSVAGDLCSTDGTTCQSFLWKRGSGMQLLGMLSGYVRTQALSISADGSTVSGSACLAFPSQVCTGFVWNSQTGIQRAGMPGELSSYAGKLNADGSAFIGQWNAPNSLLYQQPYIWRRDQAPIDLGAPAGSRSSQITHNYDSMTRLRGSAYTIFSEPVSWVWTLESGYQLMLLPGDSSSRTLPFNNGLVEAGQSCVTNSCRALVWSASTGFTDLAPLTNVYSASDANTVLGATCSNGCSAFYLWRRGAALQQLDIPAVLGTVQMGQYTADLKNITFNKFNFGTSAATAAIWTEADGTTLLPAITGYPSVRSGPIADNGNKIAGTACAADQQTCRPVLWTVQNTTPNQVPTSSGSDVEVTPVVTLPGGATTTTVAITFDSVQSGGTTTVTAASNPSGGAPGNPPGFKVGTPPVYYDVETTAQFNGTVTLCFSWQQGQFRNESRLKLFHFEQGLWRNVTTSLDTQANRICGEVSSLSPFALFETSYTFSGFLAPVDNLPVRNSAKAGSAIPVKFSLGADYGLTIFEAGSPGSQSTSCTSGALVDEITETSTAGASALTFDPTTGQYKYVWKTEKSWANSCRKLILKLNDGTQQVAEFQFK